ncbi:DUF1389 domain-containing protein [Chlamydia vaughanii]|uniref:DUF1389 domain-containing protein n=1 Tax=Chlamydia vaughanii TaxID=3112552 RepID=UPI0032B15545
MTAVPVSNVNIIDPPVEQRSVKDKIIQSVQEHTLIIAGAILAIISMIVIAVVSCGATHPAVIAAATVGILMAICLAVFSLPEAVSPIPEPFLKGIKHTYGSVIYKFVVQQGVTVQELRAVLKWLRSGFTEELTKSVMTKAEMFGIQKLTKTAKKALFDFDDFLVINCPAYFIKSLINSGEIDLAKSKNMTPLDYWTAPLGFAEDKRTMLDTRTWLLAQVITEEEHQFLDHSMRIGSWDQTTDKIADLQKRMLQVLDNIPKCSLFEKNGNLAENIKDTDWFRRLFVHGVNRVQLEQFKKVGIADIGVLEGCDLNDYRRDIYHYANEEDTLLYSHRKALACNAGLFC